MRLPMNLDLMIVLGHRIKGLNWGEYAKQVFWTACTTSFFSSCRMGEILAPSRNSFEPKSTLKWENVVVSSGNEILMFIPYSKTKGFKGKIVDLYPIRNCKLCPSTSLLRLRKLAIAEGVWKPERPVFSFKSGKFLTKQDVNLWLGKLLSAFTDNKHVFTATHLEQPFRVY